MNVDTNGRDQSGPSGAPIIPISSAKTGTQRNRSKSRPTATPFLLVVTGPDSGKVIGLGRGPTILGRRDGGFTDKLISRDHAKITVEGSAAILEDLDSTNGTIVGLEKIGAPTRISDGSMFYLGEKTRVLFLFSRSAPLR